METTTIILIEVKREHTFRSPGIIAGVKSQSSELLVSSTCSNRVDTLASNLQTKMTSTCTLNIKLASVASDNLNMCFEKML